MTMYNFITFSNDLKDIANILDQHEGNYAKIIITNTQKTHKYKPNFCNNSTVFKFLLLVLIVSSQCAFINRYTNGSST